MNRISIKWTTALVFFLIGIFAPHTAHSQKKPIEKIYLEVASQVPLPEAMVGTQKLLLKDAQGTHLGKIQRKEKSRILSVKDRPKVQLPQDLPALVSRNGRVILQYGDIQDLSHPSVTHLYWLDAQGIEKGRLENYFKADALVALSDDGFTAVVGSRIEKPHNKVLVLFSPTGVLVWERSIGEDRNVHSEPVVTAQGDRVVVITTNATQPLKDHRILIVDKSNKEISIVDTMGLVQKKVLVGESNTLFVQGRKRHGLIQLTDGTALWTKDGNVRLISPRGAAMNPDGDVLFLLLADWSGKPQATYTWRLKALNAKDGRELGMVKMPKKIPGTWSDLFGRITANDVEIITDTETISVIWSR